MNGGGVNGHNALPYNSLCHCYKGVGERSCNKSLGNPLQIVKVCGSKLMDRFRSLLLRAPKKRHPITWICSLDAWKKHKIYFPKWWCNSILLWYKGNKSPQTNPSFNPGTITLITDGNDEVPLKQQNPS